VKPQRKFYLITLAALLVAMATFLLGRWQLQRASLKEALIAQATIAGRKSAIENQALISVRTEELLHRRAHLTGRWKGSATIYLDNRQMNGKPGFFVLTPLVLEGSADAVVVQRGWVPRNFVDRTDVVQVQTPSGLVTVDGNVVALPSKLLDLGDSQFQQIRQNLDMPSYRRETGLNFLDLSVQQTGSVQDGLVRDWLVASSGSAVHYGYAFQWFGLCALTLFLYVWFQIVRKQARKD